MIHFLSDWMIVRCNPAGTVSFGRFRELARTQRMLKAAGRKQSKLVDKTTLNGPFNCGLIMTLSMRLAARIDPPGG
jgi:hypothetical protein